MQFPIAHWDVMKSTFFLIVVAIISSIKVGDLEL